MSRYLLVRKLLRKLNANTLKTHIYHALNQIVISVCVYGSVIVVVKIM